jgi:hypothetical protein
MRIPIIMVSGPVNSGKTLFGLTIDPNCRRPRTEVEPTTILWDQEGSADPYEGGLNFEHKDTRAAIAAGVHLEQITAGPTDPRWRKILLEKADVNDSPSASLFRAWYLSLLRIPAGKYAVGMCDTFTPLQAGLADWLRKHPIAFGRSANEYEKFAQATLWPDIKEVLAYILATDCRLRFDTFVITAHMKNEWVNKQPTGRKISEGIDVMEKLATLHMELDRTPKDKSKDAPRVPSAIVKKERLVQFGASSDDDQPILPPRVPQCTPDAIRRYIATPPDFGKLDAGERLPDTSMGEDEKLRIQAAIAENQRATEETRLSALEMARKAAEAGRANAMAQASAAVGQVPTGANGNGNVAANGTANGNGHAASQPQSTPSQVVASQAVSPITTQQATEMVNLLKQLFATGADAGKWLAEKHGTDNPATLTETQAMGVLSDLYAIKAAKQQAAIQTPAMPLPAEHSEDGRRTPEQGRRIQELTVTIYGNTAANEQAAWLQRISCSAGPAATFQQAAARIAELEAMLQHVPEDPDDLPPWQ